MSYHRK